MHEVHGARHVLDGGFARHKEARVLGYSTGQGRRKHDTRLKRDVNATESAIPIFVNRMCDGSLHCTRNLSHRNTYGKENAQ